MSDPVRICPTVHLTASTVPIHLEVQFKLQPKSYSLTRSTVSEIQCQCCAELRMRPPRFSAMDSNPTFFPRGSTRVGRRRRKFNQVESLPNIIIVSINMCADSVLGDWRAHHTAMCVMWVGPQKVPIKVARETG